MHLTVMFILLLRISSWILLSIPRSSITFNIVSDEDSILPRALIERFLKFILPDPFLHVGAGGVKSFVGKSPNSPILSANFSNFSISRNPKVLQHNGNLAKLLCLVMKSLFYKEEILSYGNHAHFCPQIIGSTPLPPRKISRNGPGCYDTVNSSYTNNNYYDLT